MANSVQFTPVETGDMREILPDAPAGAWEAVCSVKQGATSKDKYPMLILEWRLEEALTDGNEDSVGGKATDFVTFFPKRHNATRMARIRLQAMCAALGIKMPTCQTVKTWDDLKDFIDELDGCKAKIFTSVVDRATGEKQTKVYYTAPGRTAPALHVVDDDDDDDEDETPKKKTPPAKKARR